MIPLFSVSQIREADNYAIDQMGTPGLLLMENASYSVYSTTVEHLGLDNSRKIGIVCGKGNNAGDGFAVARHFVNNGYSVHVIFLADKPELKGDALQNFIMLTGVEKNTTLLKLTKYNSLRDIRALADCDVIFDALLGTGTQGGLKSSYEEIVSEINKIKAVKVAVDIPTGLNADTGYGEIVFQADLTISLAEFKKGLFYGTGRISSGQVKKGYIGVPSAFFDSAEISDYIIEPEDVILPQRKAELNKYTAGKVLVIAGSGKMTGAAVLTSNAVLKTGAGAVLLAFPLSIKAIAQSKLNEVIINPYLDEGQEIFTKRNVNDLNDRLKWMDVLAVGPGLGRDHRTIDAIPAILKAARGKKVIIDADAIFALNNEKYKDIDLRNCILTPHTGEFAGLLGIDAKELGKDLAAYGKSFVQQTGAYLVLKGSPTLIFNPEGEMFINSSGNNGMAKFGTGDVLTGAIAGFLAQTDDIEAAVISAVYLHSLAADLLLPKYTEYGYTATDISDNLPAAIKFLKDSIV